MSAAVIIYCSQLYRLAFVLLQDEITLQFTATKLDRKDFFGKSDPFLSFSRVNENSSYAELFVFYSIFD